MPSRAGGPSGLIVIATLLVAACSDSSTAPSPAPTPTPTPTPSPTVASVALTSAQMNATTYQVNATARLSDGSARDVTAVAQWSSSDRAVAEVSSTGVVTARDSGTVEIRAVYESVTGTTNLTVAVPLLSLRGTILEAPPSSRVLEGVRVNVTSGVNTGEFTYSDDRGQFTLNGLRPGALALAIAHAGHQPWTQTLTLDENITNLTVVLYPVAAPSVR